MPIGNGGLLGACNEGGHQMACLLATAVSWVH